MKNNEIKLENFKRLCITGSVIKKYRLKVTFRSTGFLYVDESDEIVCYVIIEKIFGELDTFIKEIYVSKKYKNSNLYKELIKIAVKRLYSRYAAIDKNDKDVIKLYMKCGFKKVFSEDINKQYMCLKIK